jgi:outer membrane receptor protein involved in Fe transport
MLKLLRQLLPVLLIVFLCCSSAYGQIGGLVKNPDNLLPIADVNINIVNQITGTSTNEEGRFFIDWNTFPVEVEFSALGFETISILIQHPDTNRVIYLQEVVMDLDEIVVVPDRTINPITNSSPIARSTVSIEQLSGKSVTTAVELLRAETGVYVQQTSVGQGSLYIRGRAGRDVLYLFNGFRMNPSFVRSGQNQYFGAIDPFLINKLDVYRGPVSVYYGSDALSGGVNISPIVKKFSYDKDISGEVSSFLNFEGNGEKSIHGKLAYQGPTFTLFAGGSFRDYDYYNMSEESDEALWFPYDETLSNADYQFKSFQLSSNIKVSNTSNVTLVSYTGQIPDAPRLDRQTLGFSIENPQDGLRPRNGYYSNTSPLVFWGNTAEFRQANENPAFQSVGVKAGFFRLKDFRKQQDFDFSNPPAFSISTEDRDYSFSINDTTNYDRSSSNQWLMSIDIQSRINHNFYLKWGADMSYDYVRSRSYSSFGQERLPRYPNGSEYVLSGLFAQIDFAPTNRFTLEYGARYSHTYANIPFEGLNSARKFSAYSDSYGQITHALGLSYNLTDDLALLSNISTGFRAPNVSDLSEIGVRRNDQFQTPSTALRPETTRNIDVGVMFDNNVYSLEMYTFWLHYSDKITRIETGNLVNDFGEVISLDSVSFNWQAYTEVRNINANSMDLLGVEFAGSYTNNDYIKTGLTFTYAWGNLLNIDGSTEPVDRIPPANGVFYVDYTPAENISIRPQARYAFAHRRISPAERNDNRVSQDGTDGFVNLQLLINLYPEDNFAIKFIADNLMDEAYREHSSSLDGMGRNFTISITYQF